MSTSTSQRARLQVVFLSLKLRTPRKANVSCTILHQS